MKIFFDGFRVTDFISHLAEQGPDHGKKESFEVPVMCVTQQPVVMEGKMTLPLFCGKSRNEFEMRFIEL